MDYRYPFVMDQNVSSVPHFEDDILGIYLDNNNLMSLEAAQFPPNLMQLSLSNNNLTTLPASVFKNQEKLEKLTLSGNAWKCDCNTWNWLASKISIVSFYFLFFTYNVFH